MQSFIQRHAGHVMGVISGFDRLLMRGTLRRVANAAGMNSLLAFLGVRLKEAGEWMQHKTAEVKVASLAAAEAAGRPVQYLNDCSIRKEELARQIAERDGIGEGLVCVLTAVEPCWTFDIRRDRQAKKLELVSRLRKCLYLYHYFQHPQWGLMHMRLQSWFPFTLFSCLNGREWLARRLAAEGIDYVKKENCLTQVADMERAQELMDQQLKTDWASLLEGVRRQVHPAHERVFACYPMDYYWSCQESEWASDLLFSSAEELGKLYPHLLRHGMQNLASWQVMRFLGRRVPSVGGPYGTFKGQVISDIRQRPEGMRIKHSVNGNSIKMYDKQGSVLRVETTITDPHDMKVFRGTETEPNNKKWRRMRKGVAEMHRRATVSQSANERYLESMSAAQQTTPLKQWAQPLCRAVNYKGRRTRGLNPLEQQDAKLLEIISRGEFAINGLRNRDLQKLLYDQKPADAPESRRRSAAVTRKLRLLRAHGLINKVQSTHRYMLSSTGRQSITALLAAREADTASLMKAA